MKKRTIYTWMLVSALMGGSLSLQSCRDEFTEEQALKAQQTVDLSVMAWDEFENKGVAGATVSVYQDGKEITGTTNETGVATFPGIKIGGNIPVFVTKEGFATTKTEFMVNTNNYRESQYSERVSLFATDGVSTAIIRGKVEIETDLTNNESEFVPAGTKVYAYMNAGQLGEISVEGQVDANGKYSIKVPTQQAGASYRLVFPTLELEQNLVVNGNYKDQLLPMVEPSIQKIKTTFGTIGSPALLPGQIFNPVSNSTPARPRRVFAVVEAPNDPDATYKKQAVATATIGVDGKVTGISFSESGAGYKAGTVKIDIKSLFGGTGAVVTGTAASGSLSYATITNSGSGYPTTMYGNQSTEDPSFTSSVDGLKSGEIRIVDVNYGTGVARDKDVQ